MKHLWALPSTLTLALALVVTGVASWAGETSVPGLGETTTTRSAALSSATATPSAHSLFWQLAAPQPVVAGVHLRSRGQVPGTDGPLGTRSDRQFFEISSTGGNDVPDAALRAYRNAEQAMALADPGCGISWTLLAAIGRVESNHGRFAGAQIGSDGVSRPEIRGPRLDGAGPFAAIADTDGGTLDRDPLWDRAVGPMQFLPETWSSVARDGDRDGRLNPDDIDDAALGSAVYLCGVGGSIADPAGAARAAFRYNPSSYYVDLVLAMQAGYQTGVFATPTPPPPPAKVRKPAKPQTPGKPRPIRPRGTGGPGGSSLVPPGSVPAPAPLPKPAPAPATPPPPAPGTTTPKPAPKPTPKPTPAAPKRGELRGTWNACPAGFCVSGTALDLGPVDRLDTPAAADFDGDGAVETNRVEFTGLIGKRVTLSVEYSGGGTVVLLINGKGLRNADGSFARPSALASDGPSSRRSSAPSELPSELTSELASEEPGSQPSGSASGHPGDRNSAGPSGTPEPSAH